jgi:hypothetical protein
LPVALSNGVLHTSGVDVHPFAPARIGFQQLHGSERRIRKRQRQRSVAVEQSAALDDLVTKFAGAQYSAAVTAECLAQ